MKARDKFELNPIASKQSAIMLIFLEAFAIMATFNLNIVTMVIIDDNALLIFPGLKIRQTSS